MAQKFIIKRNGALVMGHVGYHFELFDDTNDRIQGCYGGGMYEIDDEAKEVRLSGESGDFGRPRFVFLQSVPEQYADYTFKYLDDVVYPIPEPPTKAEDLPAEDPLAILPTDSRQVRRKKERALAKRNRKK